MKKIGAEFIGTFFLVFAGTGAMVINEITGGAVSHVGVALTFGLIVAGMIYSVGDVSGAHLNPAVTFAFWRARRFPGREVPLYWIAQFAGAILASFLLKYLFPENETMGATIPSGAPRQSFLLEVIISFMLMFVIFNVSTGAKEKGTMAGLAIGATVCLAALFAGPVCGASMNPARSLGPALFNPAAQPSLWIYLTAPVLGAWLAVPACFCLRPEGCCGDSSDMEKSSS